jgi:hypothetical protein
MIAGESDVIVFRAKKSIISHIIDWFGKDVDFYDETEDDVKVRVRVNLNAMKYWVMQYSSYITVLSPESFVREIKLGLMQTLEKYKEVDL